MSSHYDTAAAMLDDAENAGGTQTEIQQSQVHALLGIATHCWTSPLSWVGSGLRASRMWMIMADGDG